MTLVRKNLYAGQYEKACSEGKDVEAIQLLCNYPMLEKHIYDRGKLSYLKCLIRYYTPLIN